MENTSIELLNIKLKNAPQGILNQVNSYVDLLFESSKINKNYTLTPSQQQILDSQVNCDKKAYIDAESLFTDLKNKYEL